MWVVVQMARQTNWLIAPLTDSAGRELEALTLLGQFFAASPFAEDNVS
jgi:hypothetical protein